MNKVTMKDIAQRAEVSSATVSYVLNNNEKEKINEETREKILRIAKELNYVPNLNARSLVNKKSKLVGAIVVRDYKTEGPWKKNFYNSYINCLERELDKHGYHLLISNVSLDKPNLDIVLQRQLEAVFVIDVDKEFFYKISNNFTVPIIIVDSIIDDALFYKIYPDFEDAVHKALKGIKGNESYLITQKFNNSEIMDTIKNSFPQNTENVYVMENIDGLKNFLNDKKDAKGIIINEYIGLLAERYIDSKNITVISVCDDAYLLSKDTKIFEFNTAIKAEKSAELMEELLEKKYRGNKYLALKTE